MCERAYSAARIYEEYSGLPDVGYIVELGDDAVPVVGPSKTVLFVHLGREVAEDDDGGRVWPQEDGANEQLEVFERLTITETDY